MDIILIAVSATLGLAFGSFANVVIHRVPEGRSVVAPPSACPGCRTRIAAWDNVPLLSWLWLRGRCRHCGQPIGIHYPAVELTMGVVFAAVAWRVGLDWSLPGFWLFAWVLAVVAVIDSRTRRIPNRLTYPLTPTLLVLLAGAAVLQGSPGTALRTLLGGALAFVALLALALISPRGMGMGDVKLAAFVGIGLGYLGWGHVVLGFAASFLIGGVVGIALLSLRLRGRKDAIPFGPYLAAGALTSLLVGSEAIAAYRQVSGLG
jgi:leader peptidase (prepilin peptidase) / N-methyltransferase